MIVPMKKAQIVVLKDEKELLLKSLQRYGVLMLIPNEEQVLVDTTNEDSLIQRAEKSLKIMKQYREKKGLFKDLNTVDYDSFISINPEREKLLEKIENADEEIAKLTSDNQSIQESINYYLPWEELDMKLSLISKLKYAKIHTGYIEPRNTDSLLKVINDFGGEINLLGKAPEGQAIVFACYLGDEYLLLDQLKNLGFLEVTLPNEDKFASTIITEKKELINSNLQKIEELKLVLADLSKQVEELELLSDQIKTYSELKKAAVTETLETTYLQGWVRSDEVNKLKKAIDEITEIYDLEIMDPAEGEVPPTATKNNKFVSSFEAITDMFAKPNHNEADPNPIMSIWYWIIFGFMMGDAGYGLVMVILFYGLIKLMHPKGGGLKLFRLLMYSGITTIIWGIIFGSYFGATYHPILEPMKEPLKLLIISMIFGAFHVISGVLMKAYNNLRNKNYLDIIYDQVSWILIIVGLGLFFLPKYKNYGTYMALVGTALVLFFAGRAKKNIFGRLGSGLYSLYGATGYMSDILSYSRLLALCLSGAVIAYVMNLLAGMLQGNPIGFVFSIIVYIIGHVFNIAMSLLSAYVHDSRLQYIEFFNKFYEGGGYEFKPLSLQLNYIDQVNEKK